MVRKTKTSFPSFFSSAQAAEETCQPPGPAGEQHPVQALLENVEAGPGCAAREHGNKETHAVALGSALSNTEDKVSEKHYHVYILSVYCVFKLSTYVDVFLFCFKRRKINQFDFL